jgi:hypothetical protein
VAGTPEKALAALATAVARVPEKPTAAPPATKPAVVKTVAPRGTAGTFAADDRGPSAPLRTWPAAHDVRPASAPPVTDGMVVFEDHVRPGTAKPNDAVQLKQRVLQVCGHDARAVQIMLQADGRLCVQVEALNPGRVKSLTDRILRLPELASPAVRLEVTARP